MSIRMVNVNALQMKNWYAAKLDGLILSQSEIDGNSQSYKVLWLGYLKLWRKAHISHKFLWHW